MSPRVYFMMPRDGGPIRIGCTSKYVETRLSSLMCMAPTPLSILATIPGYRVRELMLHYKFAADRVHGEWFRPTARLWAIIAEAQATGDIAALPSGPLLVATGAELLDSLAAIGISRVRTAELLKVSETTVAVWERAHRASSSLTALYHSMLSGWLTEADFAAGPVDDCVSPRCTASNQSQRGTLR